MAIKRNRPPRRGPRPPRNVPVTPGAAPGWDALSEAAQAQVVHTLSKEGWVLFSDSKFRGACFRCQNYIPQGNTPIFWRRNPQNSNVTERMHVDPCGISLAKIMQTTGAATTTTPIPGNPITRADLVRNKLKNRVGIPKKKEGNNAAAEPEQPERPRAKFAAFDPTRYKFGR